MGQTTCSRKWDVQMSNELIREMVEALEIFLRFLNMDLAQTHQHLRRR